MARHRPAPERFAEKVNRHGPIPEHRPELGPCWLWTAALSREGYGRFRGPEGKTLQAHRYALELHLGRTLHEPAVDHLCRRHECVNPAHLEPVEHAVNIARGESPVAIAVRTNTCHRGHSLADAYRAHRSDGRVTRRCRTCALERERARARRRTP